VNSDESDDMAPSHGLVLTALQARQLALHVGSAARCAVSGDVGLATTEAVLAWAVLSGIGAGAMGAEGSDGLPNGAELADRDGDALRAYLGARESAHAFIGHFVSEQQPDVVTIYESAVAVLDTAIASLTAAPHE
jgi:hypothetical protein